eukprot:9215058-Alexandrium_andersonii.AAC.1
MVLEDNVVGGSLAGKGCVRERIVVIAEVVAGLHQVLPGRLREESVPGFHDAVHGFQGTPSAVSYTHLRAHETSAHL